MSKRYHVYGLGAALVDTEVNVTDADLTAMGVEKGLMILADEARQKKLLNYLVNTSMSTKRTSGGSTANAIAAIAQFGGQTFYCCKLGNDDNGQFYLRELQASGVDCLSKQRHDEGTTGTCLVMITPDAERTLVSFLGANAALTSNDIIPEAIIASDYVYFEAYVVMSPTTLSAAIRARDIVEQNGVKIVLSFSDPGVVQQFRKELCEILINPVDLLFCNRKEAFSWTQTDDLETAIDSLKKIARTFAITLGADGALLYDGTLLHRIAAHKVQAVNTNGAGDMFAGAFLYGITLGRDFPTAGKLASLAAAAVVSELGARLTTTKQKDILTQWSIVNEM